MRGVISKIKSSKDLQRIGGNFLSLSVLNFINYLFPLILIPYLARVLGVDKYGLYAFALASLNYLVLIVKYGFEFSATKQVAIIRDDIHKLSQLFASVLTVRIILFFVSLLVLITLVVIVPKFSEEKLMLFFGTGIILGWALIPIWFFQGMENMKYVTIVNFFTRLIATMLVFIFVKSPDDYELALLFQSIGLLSGGILSLFLAFKIFKIKFVIPTWPTIMFQLKDGWQLFISTIGMNFYRESNVLILGFFTDYTLVGYYAAAEKVVKAIQSLTQPVTNALYPYFGRKLNAEDTRSSGVKNLKRIGLYLGSVLFLISILVLVLSPAIIKIYLSDNFIHSIKNVQIMSFVILFGGLNYFYGIVGLVNLGYEKRFTQSVWVSGIISVIVCIALVPQLRDVGASLAMLVAEIVLFVQIFVSMKFIKVK